MAQRRLDEFSVPEAKPQEAEALPFTESLEKERGKSGVIRQ